MIIDKLKRAEIYYPLSDGIRSGLEWLLAADLKTVSDGKYIINDRVFVNIQTYMPKESAPFEAHKEYIDIQYMISGEERIGVADISQCSSSVPYDKERDIEFLVCSSQPNLQCLREGDFILLFPHDAHQPSVILNSREKVKKAVVKVRI